MLTPALWERWPMANGLKGELQLRPAPLFLQITDLIWPQSLPDVNPANSQSNSNPEANGRLCITSALLALMCFSKGIGQ